MTTLSRSNDVRNLLVDTDIAEGFTTTSWGEASRTRLSLDDTKGALAIIDYRAPAGFGPPRHFHHKDDEIFLIQSGDIVLWTPTGYRTAGPGDVILLPKLMPHTWRAYGEAPVRFQITIAPGEFETFFHRIVAKNLTITDVEALIECANEAGMVIVGAPLNDDEVAAILRGETV